MKITALETIHLAEHPNITFVQVHTDEGLVGLGDTFRAPTTVAAYVHEVAAPLLLGKDPLAIEQHWQTLFTDTVGGALRCAAPRCAGSRPSTWRSGTSPAQAARPAAVPAAGRPDAVDACGSTTPAPAIATAAPRPAGATANYLDGQREGPYEDLDAFLNRADELAQDLLSEGYTAMKIWPFDQFGPPTNGQRIDLTELERGLRAVREDPPRRGQPHGDRPGDAQRLGSACRPSGSPGPSSRTSRCGSKTRSRMDNLDALLQFRQSTRVPTTASETMSTRWAVPRGAREARRLDRHARRRLGRRASPRRARSPTWPRRTAWPIAPHDCVGPITLMASVHLDYAVPNVFIQEVVRAYLHGVYPNLVTTVPKVEHGTIRPPEGPGLGTQPLTRPGQTPRRNGENHTAGVTQRLGATVSPRISARVHRLAQAADVADGVQAAERRVAGVDRCCRPRPSARGRAAARRRSRCRGRRACTPACRSCRRRARSPRTSRACRARRGSGRRRSCSAGRSGG